MTRFIRQQRLVTRAVAGDPGAIGELYDVYGADALRVAGRIMNSVADAEDVVHDVFVGLPKALATFEHRGSLEGWLRKVTVRTALMKLRDERRRTAFLRRYSTSLTAPSAPSADERLSLDDALSRLDERWRVVMTLRIEGYRHSEIAQFLGISTSASKMRYRRACQQMRRFFDRV